MLIADFIQPFVMWPILAVIVLAFILLVPYGLGPVLIYLTHKQSAMPKLVAFQPGATPLPVNVDKFFHSSSWALTQEGFTVETGLFLPSQIEHIVVALILLINRRESDAAIVAAMHSNAPMAESLTQFHTEFVTRYRDGRIVQTNNADTLNAFPPPTGAVTSYFPSIKDPQQLYRLHQAQSKRHGSGQKYLPLDEQHAGNAVAYVTAAMVEELNEACQAGYMWLDRAAASYRPTIGGAFKMTYGELWPFKSFRRGKRARRERQMLDELAFEVPGINQRR